jgi:hypothetical protein
MINKGLMSLMPRMSIGFCNMASPPYINLLGESCPCALTEHAMKAHW